MPDGLFLLHDFEPELEWVRSYRSETESVRRGKILARLRRRLEKARFDVSGLKSEVTRLYIEAAQRDADPPGFMRKAQISIENWQATAEKFRSEVDRLQRELSNSERSDATPEQFFRDSLNIAVEWLDAVATFRDQLLEWSTLPAAAGEKLRARPVPGKIDYAELSREHIARYPKIRARLAE
jgi:hypothetical protein